MATLTKGSASATGTLPQINTLLRGNNFQAVIQTTISGTATYSIDYTIDGTNWVVRSDANGITAGGTFTLTFPVAAIRVRVTAISGTLSYALLEM